VLLKEATPAVELLGVLSGLSVAEGRLRGAEPAMTQSTRIETPIQRRPILAKSCLILDFAPAQNTRFHTDATMKIRGNFALPRQSSHIIVPQDRPGPQKAAKPRDPVASGDRDAAKNRVASHDYFLLEKFEAGIALRGTEVKSIREGKANLKDAYGLVKDGEAFLLNVHIGPAPANC
jgi:hypothetical protein